MNFSKTSFSDIHQTLFEATYFHFCASDRSSSALSASASFINVIFPATVLFRRCDLSRVSFADANVENARFDECYFNRFRATWNKTERGREVAFATRKPRKIFWDVYHALHDKNATAKDFESAETRCRQMKKNFEDKKDWASSGDFYHGEMVMRLRKYEAERKEKAAAEATAGKSWRAVWTRKIHHVQDIFFLYWFKWISDFNESLGRALAWLGGLIGISVLLVFTQIGLADAKPVLGEISHGVRLEIFGCAVLIGIYWAYVIRGKHRFSFGLVWTLGYMSLAYLGLAIFITGMNLTNMPQDAPENVMQAHSCAPLPGGWQELTCRLNQAGHLAVTAVLPLYSLTNNQEEAVYASEYGRLLPWFYKIIRFFSIVVWSLLVLSIRQKLRR